MQESIGRFTVKREIGHGGMAVVYLAHDPQFEREVAIKLIRRSLSNDPDFRARFEREAKIIASLEHPAIVPVYEYGEHKDQPYLVMRYMRGGALDERLSRNDPLPFDEAARILEALAPALDYAHERGIIHRDLKPENIFFDHLNNPHIGDFGIARRSVNTTQLTEDDAMLGTLAYMSPEQLRGEALDGNSDRYALGVILYEMLTGKHPFSVLDPLGYISAHLHEPVPDIRGENPSLPADLTDVFYRTLAKTSSARYPSAAALAGDLRAAMVETSVQDRRTRTPVIWIAGTILALLIAGGGLVLGDAFPGSAERVVETQEVVVQITATRRPTSMPAPPSDTPTPTATSTDIPVELPPRNLGWIAFDSDRDTALFRREIYRVRPDGEDLTRLTLNEADDLHPSWSPDGAQIAFSSDRDGDIDLYIMNADGQDVTRLTDSPGRDEFPTWSPDGTRIAFVSERDGNREIYMVAPDGSNPTRLTDHPADDDDPDWSPDSQQIVFSSKRASGSQLYILDIASLELTRITLSSFLETHPSWSPDGNYIFRTSFPPEAIHGALYVMEKDGSNSALFYHHSAYPSQDASWSPDEAWIAFARGRQADGLGWDIVVMRADGTNLSTVIQTRTDSDQHPDWGP